MMQKVWFDGSSPAPPGWTSCNSASSAIGMLSSGLVEEISFGNGIGHAVLVWIYDEVVKRDFYPPIIKIHSVNETDRERMELELNRIKAYNSKRLSSRPPPS